MNHYIYMHTQYGEKDLNTNFVVSAAFVLMSVYMPVNPLA